MIFQRAFYATLRFLNRPAVREFALQLGQRLFDEWITKRAHDNDTPPPRLTGSTKNSNAFYDADETEPMQTMNSRELAHRVGSDAYNIEGGWGVVLFYEILTVKAELTLRSYKDWEGGLGVFLLPTELHCGDIGVYDKRQGKGLYGALGAIAWYLTPEKDTILCVGWRDSVSVAYKNKAYVKIMSLDEWVETSWDTIKNNIENSDYGSSSVYEGITVKAKISEGFNTFMWISVYRTDLEEYFVPLEDSFFEKWESDDYQKEL